MALHTPGERRLLAQSAERQMRQWAMRWDIRDRLEREKEEAAFPERLGPYLALSREAGAGGGEIATRLGERLGWEVLDANLLDYMAQEYHLPRGMLTFVDETTANWIQETFGNWLDKQVVSQEEYVAHLGPIILMAARHGNVIFVGRGAQFFLPSENGMRVRLIAPEKERIERTMQRRKMDWATAEGFVRETDRGRRDFVRRYFHQEIGNPHLYDLVINLAHIGPHFAVDLIVELYQHRFANAADTLTVW